MQNALETLFPHHLTLGERYKIIGMNLWTNFYVEWMKKIYRNHGLKFEDRHIELQDGLANVNNLFTDVINKLKKF